MKKNSSKLIVAMDIDSLAELRRLCDILDPHVEIYKVGSQLFTSCGPAAVRFLLARGKKVFLDLKFHDIPNTVAQAVSNAVKLNVALERSQDYYRPVQAKKNAIFMYTIHICGGLEMMKAAVDAGFKTAQEVGVTKPLAVGVTVLTSEVKKDNIQNLVLERALLAEQAGLDGVVASPQEASFIRKQLGKDFIIVTPGIRPAGGETQDQKRVATPKAAIDAGSSFLVVGRPVVQAKTPGLAVKEILAEIN